jgi:predicted amidophosphoribosyltransferase
MTKLCDNCGHPLPNAAGAGLYCNECGEPVRPEWVYKPRLPQRPVTMRAGRPEDGKQLYARRNPSDDAR